MDSGGAPPPPTVIGAPSQGMQTVPKPSGAIERTAFPLMCGTEGDALGHHAIPHEVPQGYQQLARQGDDHLLARATIVLGAHSEPLGQCAVLLELEETPRELDHPPAHPSVAGSGKPLLAALAAALVGRIRRPLDYTERV